MATAEREKPKTKKRSAKSLRKDIRERLLQIEDTKFLYAMLVFMQNRQNIPVKLSTDVLRAIAEAERDDAESRLCSHEKVMEETRRWLDENP